MPLFKVTHSQPAQGVRYVEAATVRQALIAYERETGNCLYIESFELVAEKPVIRGESEREEY